MSRFDRALLTAVGGVVLTALAIGVAYFAGHQDGRTSATIDCADEVSR